MEQLTKGEALFTAYSHRYKYPDLFSRTEGEALYTASSLRHDIKTWTRVVKEFRI